MVATILNRPTFNITLSNKSSKDYFKPTLNLRFQSSKSILFGKLSFKNLPNSRIMNELVKTSAFKSGDSDENVKILQQDGFVERSSDFNPQALSQGFEPLLNRLSKWLVAALFGGVLLWRHDAEALWIAMGSVLNAGLSVVLKRIFNQERPFTTGKSDPGMPSSHAQCIFYTAVFCSLSVIESLGVNEWSLIISALNLALGSYFSWLRVSQKYHTASQVAVGAAVGSVFSFLWYWSWQNIVLEEFNSSLSVRVVVVGASFAFCLGFLFYVIRHWLTDED